MLSDYIKASNKNDNFCSVPKVNFVGGGKWCDDEGGEREKMNGIKKWFQELTQIIMDQIKKLGRRSFFRAYTTTISVLRANIVAW